MKRDNWKEFKEILEKFNIRRLYHFTDRSNLKSIIENGGLYSWADCESRGIKISKPGGGNLSRQLDRRDNLQNYVRLSFTKEHPMMYVAMKEDRIPNPVILEIDPSVIFDESTKFTNMNATRTGAKVGGDLNSFKSIHFHSVKASKQFDLDIDEQPYYQAEVLVKQFLPIKYICNISNFGIPLPQNPHSLVPKHAYTAQITRTTPTAFIFLIDHSVSMNRRTVFNGREMMLADAVANIVNKQLNDLLLRCIKYEEIRDYYDIAMIGYGKDAYSIWEGTLSGKGFVKPSEILRNPIRTTVSQEEVKTRRGSVLKAVTHKEWIRPRNDGAWTHLHKALEMAKDLLTNWMREHHGKDCYPPTIINITDGEYNGISDDSMIQLADEVKSMHTNDGNVLFFNIHVSPEEDKIVAFPTCRDEVKDNVFADNLYSMSSLLPLKYNNGISDLKTDTESNSRHVALYVNSDMSTLVQLMDIGTPTNINQNI